MDRMTNRNVLIGLAWPYANGSLHIGHGSVYVYGDILARYHRQKGDNVAMVSGSDCHGTPIAVEAEQNGISPREFSDKYHEEFIKTLDDMSISYDVWTKTSTKEHANVVQELFIALKEKDYVYEKESDGLYSPDLNRFLPDRFVEGECPKCGADDARGDQCDTCGSLLDSLELINPKANKKIFEEGLKLEVKKTTHFYFKLSAFQKELEKWVNETSDKWNQNASTFTKSFLEGGLKDRAITRDTDWGIDIPVEGYEDKKIYVWFDAVIGYLSAAKLKDNWEDFWLKPTIQYYVHGKDNIPFHTIIFPAILMGNGTYNLPTNIVSNEFINLEGKKMSTSKGWAVWLNEFISNFDSELIRYFFIANGPEKKDSNFVWSEFQSKVNGELIGTFGNLVNRVFTFVQKNFPDGIDVPKEFSKDSQEMLDNVEKTFENISQKIENHEFRSGFKDILHIAEDCNKFMHDKEPWKDKNEEVLFVLSHAIKSLGILVHPFLPKSSEKILNSIGITNNNWEYPKLEKIIVEKTETLYKKVEDEDIAREVAKLHK